MKAWVGDPPHCGERGHSTSGRHAVRKACSVSGHVADLRSIHECLSSSAHSMEYDGRSTHVSGSGGPGDHAKREFSLP